MKPNNKSFSPSAYLSSGITNLIKSALKISIINPREASFLIKSLYNSKVASNTRKQFKENIPPFLIASITNSCNLHCAGCYARANHSCDDDEKADLLTTNDWDRIFTEAEDIGISFILLAGGEPFIRRDVLGVASKHKKVIFPIFTNATMFNSDYLKLFNENRNLIPMLSIEGDKSKTDIRRGKGVSKRVEYCMKRLKTLGIFYGVSITVTSKNLREVASEKYINSLKDKGVKVMLFVEYVPVTEKSADIALNDKQRKYLNSKIKVLRTLRTDMLFISFPGDEKKSGGCLAAGRGFFHINATGSAEPCPFSPYSDTNLKNLSLLHAIHSPLFNSLQSGDYLENDHIGGCVLFEKQKEVESLLK